MARTGRPSEYEKDFPRRTRKWVDEKKETNKYPTIAGLATHLNKSKKTLYTYGEKHKNFLHELDYLRQAQEEALWERGLEGKWNSNIVKLGLHHHGYSDRSDFTSGDEPVQIVVHSALKDEPEDDDQ